MVPLKRSIIQVCVCVILPLSFFFAGLSTFNFLFLHQDLLWILYQVSAASMFGGSTSIPIPWILLFLFLGGIIVTERKESRNIKAQILFVTVYFLLILPIFMTVLLFSAL